MIAMQRKELRVGSDEFESISEFRRLMRIIGFSLLMEEYAPYSLLQTLSFFHSCCNEH